MADFVGRGKELNALQSRLDWVTKNGEGMAVAIRGRRQVGKSRLVQEFCNRAGVPYMYFTAAKGVSPVDAVASFVKAIKDSPLADDPNRIPAIESGRWEDAFKVLSGVLSERPAIVAIDEMPWLSEQDELFESMLKNAWDLFLSKEAFLLILLGSDMHMMERMAAYDRPMYGRTDNFPLRPLNVAETAQIVGLSGADAVDAQLVSGGLPGILRKWSHGMPALPFLKQACTDPGSPLFVVPADALLAEFPQPDHARRVLEAVGSGDRTHANIAAAAGSRAGGLPSGVLSPILRTLVEKKGMLAIDEPLSIQSGRPALYRVADTNMRLYLAALREARELTWRDLPDDAFRLIERRWSAWRGRAVEPLIRDALERGAYQERLPWPEAHVVGGWWNRQFNPELDLVGADKGPVASQIFYTGSIKWLNKPFDRRDLAQLVNDSAKVPGYVVGETAHVVVSQAGIASNLDRAEIGAVWGPDDVVAQWQAN